MGAIWDLAKREGKSIILISSDMPEVINVARHILVFKDFRIVGEVENNGAGGAPVRGYDEVSQEIGRYLA